MVLFFEQNKHNLKMTFLREDGHRPTQDELQLMHVHLDNVKQPSFVDCYAPVYETLQYSPSIAFQTNLQSHANTKNSFFPNISKDTQQSILTKNQRAQAINDVQSQMIASKIPLCLVQDIYGRLHQLVYMIPQNLYDQFSNNVQVGKKVTLRSHYETLQSKQKSDNELNPSKNKESDLSPLKLTKQQQQQQQQIVLQTHVQKYNALQLQEAQKQQQLLLQQQNQQKQQEALLQQHQKQQQFQSQKQQELQQLHQQQQLQQQVQHQHQLQHELQHKLQQQLQQHLLFLLQPQALATPPLSPPSQQLDQQELQMQQQKLQNHQNQDQQQLLHSPPPQQHMQHQLQQQLVLQENWTKDKTIVSTCDMTKNEKPVFASADSSTEFQYTLNVKPSTDNYEEIPRDMFLENSNKNSSKPQTVSLSEYLELDSNTQLNEASSLSLHSVKKAKTNDPTPMCESSSINIISSRKRKSSETSDYEEDLKKSNLTSKENNFEKLFMEESITLINNDTMSEENQESIWTSFWDEISSTSNDSEIFISEELSYINNNRLLDSSYIHTKDDCKSNNNDFVEEYNKRDFLQCEPLDQFDLFQHILM